MCLFKRTSFPHFLMVKEPKVFSRCIALYYFWNNKRLWRSHVVYGSSVGWLLSHIVAEVICRITFMHLLFLVKSSLIEGLVLISRSEWSSFFALLINLCSRFRILHAYLLMGMLFLSLEWVFSNLLDLTSFLASVKVFYRYFSWICVRSCLFLSLSQNLLLKRHIPSSLHQRTP